MWKKLKFLIVPFVSFLMTLATGVLQARFSLSIEADMNTVYQMGTYEPEVKTLVLEGERIKWINLNPGINEWYLLGIATTDEKVWTWFHLENPNPKMTVRPEEDGIHFIKNSDPFTEETEFLCSFWPNRESPQQTDSNTSEVFDIRKIDPQKYVHPFLGICKDNLFLRLPKPPNTYHSPTEWTTQLLRQTSIGEELVNMVKPFVVGISAEDESLSESKDETAKQIEDAKVDPNAKPLDAVTNIHTRSFIDKHELGITLSHDEKKLRPGHWYQTKFYSNIFVSLFTPGEVPEAYLKTYKDRVLDLLPDEKNKLIYLIAYDLDDYAVKFSAGTDEPPIDKRLSPYFKHIVPLGTVPAYLGDKVSGIFIGGFKGIHGSFKQGLFKGKDYGFYQNGVELAKMSSGLATFWNDREETVHINSWPAESPNSFYHWQTEVTSARQNGLMLMENGEPAEYVGKWFDGNWSGDAQGLRRTLRAGVCLQKKNGKTFLIFGAFTAATPSSMTRVMQAYKCDSGMHLDMNAFMYLHHSIVKVVNHEFKVEYLHKDMQYPVGTLRHRYLLDNSDRDFFYVYRK